MLATQCSKPAAMKAMTGSRAEKNLSVTDVAAWPTQTARHTSMLQRMARAKATPQSSAALPSATVIAASPTAPPLAEATPAASTSPAASTLPTRLPKSTRAQLASRRFHEKRPASGPMTMRQLPVKSSAPAARIRKRPSVKAKPPRSCVAAKGSAASDLTTSMNVAPIEMKAPAMTESTRALTTSVLALVSATRSFLSSIDAGVIAPL